MKDPGMAEVRRGLGILSFYGKENRGPERRIDRIVQRYLLDGGGAKNRKLM